MATQLNFLRICSNLLISQLEWIGYAIPHYIIYLLGFLPHANKAFQKNKVISMLMNSSQSNRNSSILMVFGSPSTGSEMPSNILKRHFISALNLRLLILSVNQSAGSDLRLWKKFRFSSYTETTKHKSVQIRLPYT